MKFFVESCSYVAKFSTVRSEMLQCPGLSQLTLQCRNTAMDSTEKFANAKCRWRISQPDAGAAVPCV
ncbi:Uncharacterized protein APZ42_014789 [Daphnia magna]|uniref:Uncharacterized protein n=1 Tax=Daphnia magna TaxID=35525 RepID=A0A162PLF2_9CRUS|nr:Uncharacterized protein APZ42_014789 [Daphnia magna]